jgi:hypothetical protein
MSGGPGWFDKTVSIKDVAFLLGLVFALGQTWSRFQNVRDDLREITEQEEFMATKEELGVLERRLDKKIEILNDVTEDLHRLELALARCEVQKDGGT